MSVKSLLMLWSVKPKTLFTSVDYLDQKPRYLLGLAEHFTNGAFDQRAWHRMDDEAVIENLIQVKGDRSVDR